MRQFLYHSSQAVLTLFWGVCILMSIAIFGGIGFASGMFLGCWEDVSTIKFDDLEYDAIDTWQQHLEVYSSVCEVQEADKIAFLVDKLERLAYKQVSEIVPRLSQPGEYAKALDVGQKNGTVRIHLRNFEYPHLDVKAGHVKISVRDGEIVSIRGDDNSVRQNFYLQPEKLADIADQEDGTTRRLIPLLQMPRRLLGAFIAIEDKRFYKHWGVDILGLARAFKNTLLHGRRLAGTSTLTQQLARNIYLFDVRSDRSVVRKAREILLAVRIEKAFSKDEILERYLNHVDLGRSKFGGKTLRGVQQAGLGYFEKKVSELSNHECAMLAALPKGPHAFSPFFNPEKAKSRRDIILGKMLEQDYINASEWLEGVNADLLPLNPPGSSVKMEQKEAGHFLQYIHEELNLLPELKEKLYSGGLKVYTTIDMSMQAVAERAVAEHLRYMDSTYGGRRLPNYDTVKQNRDSRSNYLQAAVIAFEPKTGYIKAMVGGRDYYIGGGHINYYNRAIDSDAVRQPGSAFKPIVFASLLEEPSLVTPATVIMDEEWGIVPFRGQWWAPSNYIAGRFRGPVNVREVLTHSINVPTARAMWETPLGANNIKEGINRTVNLAKRMGIESPLDPKPALSLGASGVTVLELTSAYAIFANGGIRTTPKHILYILDADGNVIYPATDSPSIDGTPVLDARVAYQITSCLENVLDDGTAGRARRAGFKRPAAGKTGTTNSKVDAWFVGYTPDLVVGVWVGFDNYRQDRRNYNRPGSEAALPIWTEFMRNAARGPAKEFPIPDGIVFREIDKTSGLVSIPGKCPEENISREPFIEGQVPNQLCNIHR